MWANSNGVGVEDWVVQPTRVSRPPHGVSEDEWGPLLDSESDEDSRKDEEGSLVSNSNCKIDVLHLPISSAAIVLPATRGVQEVSTNSDKDLFVDLRREHDRAKAVKSDDAEVPVHVWDAAVCRADPTERQSNALTTLREFCLRVYRRRLTREIQQYMRSKFGQMVHNWTHCLAMASSIVPRNFLLRVLRLCGARRMTSGDAIVERAGWNVPGEGSPKYCCERGKRPRR